MATAEQLTDEQLDERVINILSRELSLSEFVRYLRLHRSGTGDYTRDRHQWLDRLTMDDIVRDLKELEATRRGEPKLTPPCW